MPQGGKTVVPSDGNGRGARGGKVWKVEDR